MLRHQLPVLPAKKAAAQYGQTMLVRHITVGGLRAYGPQPTQVDLAPLTLIFGQNSAGKSTLCSVLPILQQTAVNPDTLAMSGDLVQGGTFRGAIHSHDLSLPLTLGFGWNAPDGETRGVTGVFRWDETVGRADRTELQIEDNGQRFTLTGPRPWPGQDGNARALSLVPEFFDVLSQVFFLGPMRARPERTTVLSGSAGHYVGPAGERMAELLAAQPDLLERVNDWCERLGLGYRVRVLHPVAEDVLTTAGDFAILVLEDTRHGEDVLVSPHSVGYGVGQLLPVITQCLLASQGLVIVEQPEVHLHPRLQAAVGDLFIDTVAEGRGQMLIETHSEHLILRLLRRVREGVLEPDQMTVLYADVHEDGGTFLRELEVDRSGDLVDGWPGGFFEERLAEVLPNLGDRVG